MDVIRKSRYQYRPWTGGGGGRGGSKINLKKKNNNKSKVPWQFVFWGKKSHSWNSSSQDKAMNSGQPRHQTKSVQTDQQCQRNCHGECRSAAHGQAGQSPGHWPHVFTCATAARAVWIWMLAGSERAHSHLVQLRRSQLCSIQNTCKQCCVTRRSLTPTQQTLLVLQLKPKLPLSSVMQNLVRSEGLLKSPQYSNSAVLTDTSETPSALHYWQPRKGMAFPCK